MIYLKQSTASQEMLLGPFVDDTDGKTAETGLSIANTDIKIHKAGATTLASKNSGGGTHISNGNYYAVFDATDTDTLGSGAVVVQISGALAVRHDICVLAANVYDSLIGGGDLLDVSTTQFNGSAVTAASGRPEVNLTHIAGSAVSTTTAQLGVNAVQISGDGTAADNLENAFDDTAGPVPWMGIVDQGTAQAATSTTLQLRSAAAFGDDGINGCIALAFGSTQGYWQARLITDYTGSTDTATVDAWAVTPSGTITYKVYAGPASPTTKPDVNVFSISGDSTAADNAESFFDGTGYAGTNNVIPTVTTVNGLGSGVITATAIAADAITAAKIADGAIDAATFAAGAINAAAIASDAITAAKVADGTIDAATFAAGAINAAAIATDAITSAKIAADAIGASELAADAVTEIQSGLSTLTAAGVRSAVGLATANLDTQLAAIQSDTDDIQTRLPAALVSGRIDASVGAMAADTLTSSALAASAVTEIQSGLATSAALAAAAAVLTKLDTMLEVGPGSPTDYRLSRDAIQQVQATLGVASANLDAQLAAIFTSVGTRATPAQVNAEVVDALATDTYAEPAQGAPAATASLAAKLGYLHKMFRNKKTQTASVFSLFDDAGSTVDQKATVSDDGTTTTVGEIASGP